MRVGWYHAYVGWYPRACIWPPYSVMCRDACGLCAHHMIWDAIGACAHGCSRWGMYLACMGPFICGTDMMMRWHHGRREIDTCVIMAGCMNGWFAHISSQSHQVLTKSLWSRCEVITESFQTARKSHCNSTPKKTLWRAVAPSKVITKIHYKVMTHSSHSHHQSHHQSHHKVRVSPQNHLQSYCTAVTTQSSQRPYKATTTKSPSQVMTKVIIKTYHKSHHKTSQTSWQHSHKSSQSHPR